jgi:NADH dehydrogenase
VADLRGLLIGGPTAWLLWLAVHLTYLIGFENRVVVLVRWSYNFLSHRRAARWIIGADGLFREAAEEPDTLARSGGRGDD